MPAAGVARVLRGNDASLMRFEVIAKGETDDLVSTSRVPTCRGHDVRRTRTDGAESLYPLEVIGYSLVPGDLRYVA